jgi:aminocarboxymuconate-semialdehyde decarboxylase
VIIDIHGHISPPPGIGFKKYPSPPSLWDVAGMVESKAAAGIGLTIVGSPVGAGAMLPIPGVDNYDQPLDLIQAYHDWVGEQIALYPDNLKAYVYGNPFGGDKMLSAMADQLKADGFVGLIVNTSVNDEYLATDRAEPFFAMAAELDVPILLHPPAKPVGSDSLEDYRLIEVLGRFCDVTVGTISIVWGGWLERFPNLKLIAAAGGGALSLLPGRLDIAFAPRHWGAADAPGGGPPPGAGAGGPPPGVGGPPGAGGPPPGVGGPPGGGAPGPPPFMKQGMNITKPPSEFLKLVGVDTASPSTVALNANIQAFGVENVMFGTDAPPLISPLEVLLGQVEQLPISDEDKQMILSGNARRLFKLDGFNLDGEGGQ